MLKVAFSQNSLATSSITALSNSFWRCFSLCRFSAASTAAFAALSFRATSSTMPEKRWIIISAESLPSSSSNDLGESFTVATILSNLANHFSGYGIPQFASCSRHSQSDF